MPDRTNHSKRDVNVCRGLAHNAPTVHISAKFKARSMGFGIMTKETFSFQAEVSKLLDIVAHSLYSQKEIFLRELISNASDACDKLRYEALTEPTLIEGSTSFKILLTVDKKAKTLTVSDNGIGMSREDLVETLGTIARSGTQAFMDVLAETRSDEKKAKKKDATGDIDLIGQFGVGFYSAFMVADQIEVTTLRASENQAWLWTSDGRGEFTIEEANRSSRGTDVVVHLKKEDKEYLEHVSQWQLLSIGFKFSLYFEFLILILPNRVFFNAAPCRAKRVGPTQSKVSTPQRTKLHISEGSPIPSK